MMRDTQLTTHEREALAEALLKEAFNDLSQPAYQKRTALLKRAIATLTRALELLS